MRLIRARQFVEEFFDLESQPDLRTIRDAVAKGPHVPGGLKGRIVGNQVFVDAEWFENSTGDAIADKIMEASS